MPGHEHGRASGLDGATYPDVTRVDFDGRKRKFGGRHNSCPNSPSYRRFSVRMAEKLAERYRDHPALLIWHVSNEYGGYCYCENCAAAFREWLQRRYKTIERVNEAWNTRVLGPYVLRLGRYRAAERHQRGMERRKRTDRDEFPGHLARLSQVPVGQLA